MDSVINFLSRPMDANIPVWLWLTTFGLILWFVWRNGQLEDEIIDLTLLLNDRDDERRWADEEIDNLRWAIKDRDVIIAALEQK